MTLRRRLLLVFGVFLLLLAANAVQSRLTMTERDEILAELQRLEQARDTVARLLAAYTEQQGGLRAYVITGDEAFLEPYTANRDVTGGLRGLLTDLVGGEQRLLESVEALGAHERRWVTEVAEPEITAVRAGRRAEAESLVASRRGVELFAQMRQELRSLRLALRARQVDADHRLDGVRERLAALVVQTFAIGVLLLAVTAWLLRRWVSVPLETIAAATRAVAAGELDRPVPAPGPPEVAGLGRDAERMRRRIVDELTRTVRARQALTQHGPAVVALRAQLEPHAGTLPDGVVFAGLLEPGRGELAGDWYDASPLGRGRIGVVVGDVSGQGAAAGVLAVRVKQLLLAALDDGRAPGDALGWAARHVGDTGERFATAFVAVIDTEAWSCRWASAGHPPAIVAGATGHALLEATGPLLGPLPGAWSTAEAALPPGSLLVVCTDGVLEARDERRREFGFERLVDVVTRHGHEGPAGVVEACVDAARTFAADALDDDLTVVALGRAPAEGAAAWDQPAEASSAQ